MDKLKRSLVAKTAAFIVTVLFAVVLVLSTVVIGININYQWYGQEEKNVKENIYEETAAYAGQELVNQIYNYEIIADTTGNTHFYVPFEDELISNEKDAEGFGYKIVSNTSAIKFINNDKESKNRIVNNELIKSDDKQKYSFDHEIVKVNVFFGEISKESVPEDIYQRYMVMNNAYQYGTAALAACLISLLAVISLFIFLVMAVGYESEGKSDIGFIKRMPIEIIAAFDVVLIILLAAVNEMFFPIDNIILITALIILDTVVAATIILGFVLITVLKMKYHNLIKGSLIYIIIRRIFRLLKWIAGKAVFLIRNIPLVWKTAVVLFVGIIINLFMMIMGSAYYYRGTWMFIWFIGAVLTMAAGLYIALSFRKLKTGAEHLAEGDLNYQIDKKGLIFDMEQHADTLNRIGEGISKAVEEKIKSERFKTELITNVSHDIKTPLTSIINYVDFLKREDIDNSKAKEYIDVLDRQSARLKKLVEDLVEASKAATGAIKLNMEKCQVDVLMMQVMGEYKAKAEAENLKIVSKIPDQKLEIMADGRSLWRVFDNMMNNICKYSQPGTRVYQILEKDDNYAVITYKNTSKYELNITEDELMERFVRGDKSRNTEGSGLGLSIAKNLIELQGGSFNIHIDGDLFKVIIKLELSQ